MDEAERDRLLEGLKHDYATYSGMAEATQVALLAGEYRRCAKQAVAAMVKVRQQFEHDQQARREPPRIEPRVYTQEEWEQRLAAKKAEGAHSDVLHYIEAEITKATCSEPVPDAVWTSSLEFHCPICNEAGSIASRVAPENPVVYATPHGHADLGEGNFTCPFAGENRPWKVSQLQDRPGGAVAESDAPPEDPLITAVKQYGERMNELIEVEKRIRGISPEAEKPVPRPRKRPLNVYHGLAASYIGLTVFSLIIGNTVQAIIWMSVAAMCTLVAIRL